MRSIRSLTAMTAGTFCRTSALAFLAALLLSPCAYGAQQPATGRKKVPRLTTDDVVSPGTAQPTTDVGTDPAVKPAETAKSDAAATTADKSKVSPEESSWRESVKKARERAKELERAADETELRVTRLRNDLSVSGQSASFRNQTATELERTGQRLTEVRAQSRAATSDLNQLLEYGRQKGFTEEAGPEAVAGDGKPNEEYYRERYATLTEAVLTAERRMQLYENRVRDLNQRITSNSGTGDNFYIAHIQQERDESLEKLEEARAARAKAQSDLEALKEEARRAGLPPGIFR